MTDTNKLSSIQNKLFHSLSSFENSKIRKSIAIEQVMLETKWTDGLQELVDYGNSNVLKNFKLRLEMD
jgi:hypothetical protein